MASGQAREEQDVKAREGETVVPGGTGGKSLEAQEHLAEEQSRGGSKVGQTRKEQLGTEGYVQGEGEKRWAEHHGKVWRRSSVPKKKALI